jgi:predicted lipoprotein with Yx(FWY)xxD motif
MNNQRFLSTVKTCLLIFCANVICQAAVASDAAPASVVLEERGHGWLIRDTENMSLYMTKQDLEPGVSTCVEACATKWPPLVAAEGAASEGDWQVMSRDDGTSQWAFRGHPLYRYTGDKAQGDDFGDGFRNVWYLAIKLIEMPAAVAVRKTTLGHSLVTAGSEASLYFVDAEAAEDSECDMQCVRAWMPLKASQMASGRGDWSIMTRPDGTRQWAYSDKPLYRYNGDWNAGDTTGHQVDGLWLAAILEPSPPIPDWVTVQGSDAGFVLANADGKTLYAQALSRVYPPPEDIHAKRQLVEPDCGVECSGSHWRPVIAAEDMRSVADWSVVDREDGRQQWAYRGEPLYLHARDRIPGALHGIYSGNRSWHAMMASGESMQGTGN